MNESAGPRISVVDPVSTAIERVRLILFRPFDLERWFLIGFCAWLAFLGQGGGGSPGAVRRVIELAKHFKHEIARYLPMIIVAGAILATCCCAGCIMMIPFIGTVFLLPLLVFGRSYSLLYLAQYGPT